MKKFSLLILISALFISCADKQNVWDDDVTYNQSARRSTTTRSSSATNSTQGLQEMFGIRFGQKLSTLRGAREISKNLYLVNPSQPLANYDDYFVGVSPRDKEVISIIATKSFQNKSSCENHELKTAEKMIGEFGKTSFKGSKDNILTFVVSGTIIQITCKDNLFSTMLTNAEIYGRAQ